MNTCTRVKRLLFVCVKICFHFQINKLPLSCHQSVAKALAIRLRHITNKWRTIYSLFVVELWLNVVKFLIISPLLNAYQIRVYEICMLNRGSAVWKLCGKEWFELMNAGNRTAYLVAISFSVPLSLSLHTQFDFNLIRLKHTHSINISNRRTISSDSVSLICLIPLHVRLLDWNYFLILPLLSCFIHARSM